MRASGSAKLCTKSRKARTNERETAEVAATYNNMGMVYEKKGDLQRALELYDNSLLIKMKLLGEDHPDVALAS